MADIAYLNRLQELGVEFGISIPNQWGATTIAASPQQIVEFEDDPVAFYAKAHGVSVQNYLSWVESNYHVYCSGKTKKGKRCKNVVVGGSNVDADTWANMQGSYCSLHGGWINVASNQQ